MPAIRSLSALDDRLDRRPRCRCANLARGLLDVDVVGRQRGLELGLVQREQRRRAAARACCRVRRARRYSSRAAACSSGKPSKPSACEKRTTVELDDVFARRASSSAVWKAASSRWSTMYWATSFCERENSSKRAVMYAERVWWPLGGGRRGGGCGGALHGEQLFRRRAVTSFKRLPLPARMRAVPTSLDGLLLLEPSVHGDDARLLRRDVPRRRLGRARRRRGVRPGQPLALAPGHAARDALPDRSRSGQARARRTRERSSTWWSTSAAARRRSAVGEPELDDDLHAAAVRAGRFRARVLRPVRDGRLRLQVLELLRPGHGVGDRLRRPRCRRSSGPTSS